MHDRVSEVCKVVKSFILPVAQDSAQSFMQEVTPRRMLSERLINVVEIQFIHEAIASHLLTYRLEALPNLLKNFA